MKGFPNQVSDIVKLTNGLKVLSSMLDIGDDPTDDGVYGEALVMNDVLGTGHTPMDKEEYIQQQLDKLPNNQSQRTGARGLRELYRILGLLHETYDGIQLTELGSTLVQLTDYSDIQFKQTWCRIVQNLTHDGGDGESSHPYQMLLRLVASVPGITRAKCALALEAKNDSDAELYRIIQLAEHDESYIKQQLGVTTSNWDNAKKILPRFAEQLGDVTKRNGCFYISESPGSSTSSPENLVAEGLDRGPRKPRSASKVTSHTIAQARTKDDWDEKYFTPDTDPSMEDPQARKVKIADRHRRHNLIVQAIAAILESKTEELFENPFDCLAICGDSGILVEVKSLDGTPQDEKSRVQEALSQLLYYESFLINPDIQGKTVVKLACFESKISDAHIAWLNSMSINVLWKIEDGFSGDETAVEIIN